MRLTENVGNRRNSPGFKETQIRTERTAMRQFSSFSVTVYADSLKFGAKAANYALIPHPRINSVSQRVSELLRGCDLYTEVSKRA